MNITTRIYFLLMILILGSCFGLPNSQTILNPSVDRSDQDYNARIVNDRDRREVLSSSRSRFSGPDCSDEDRDAECREQCKDIYGSRYDDECIKELRVGQIQEIYELWKILEDADEDDLADIDTDLFDVYLNVSINSLDDLIRKEYKGNDAENVLVWLIENPEAAQVFEKEDDDYRTLNNLLREISSDVVDAFTENINGRSEDTIIELAIEEGDDDVLEWLLDYIEDEVCNNKSEIDCFRVYCRIGYGRNGRSSSRSREGWINNSEKFERYIDDILQGGVINRANWKNVNASDDPDDLDEEDWVDQLCGGLTTANTADGGTDNTGGGTDNTDSNAELLEITVDRSCPDSHRTISRASNRASTVKNKDIRFNTVTDLTEVILQKTTSQRIRVIMNDPADSKFAISVKDTFRRKYREYVEECNSRFSSCYIYWPEDKQNIYNFEDVYDESNRIATTESEYNELKQQALLLNNRTDISWPASASTNPKIYFTVKKDRRCYLLSPGFENIDAIRDL